MARTQLHDILATGVAEHASDWHIREGSNIGLRIHGKLVELDFYVNREFLERVLNEILAPALFDAYEKNGDADFAFEEDEVGRFRANLHRQRNRMSLSLRHVKRKIPTVAELGLPDTLDRLADKDNGIVFVTGVTGSGKSTTLAGMVNHMNQGVGRHVVTVEDPIEYVFEDKNCIIEQREVGVDVVSFRSALRHVLRQDPDVIIIGEMRDRETFESALVAAETGHLVLTTLHTTTAAQSILRILDLYPNEERDPVRKSLSVSLQAIICQRLVPRASGQGMVPAIEILINTPIVSKLIYENRLPKLTTAIDAGREEGMISFNRSLLDLVNRGVITEEIALDNSDNREALQMNLRGIFLSTDGAGIIE
jgi:twitching motility protein PilT